MFFERHRNHKKHIQYLPTIKGALGMLVSPEHTSSVFDIEDGLRHHEATQLAMEFVRDDPAMQSLMEERYLSPLPDTQRLLGYPKGSLGYCYAHHLDDRGFDPDYYRKIDVKDDTDYVLMRLRQTHDIWHVITGFDTDRIGEISLKAVELAQTRRPMAAVIAAGGVMRYLIKDPNELANVLQGISEGYQLGLKANLLLSQKWELEWEKPVSEWREELGVQPHRGSDLRLECCDELAGASS